MTHAEMKELYELYALGVLEPELGAEIERHLEDQCPDCMAGVRIGFQLIAGLSGVAETLSPRRELRGRILASVRPVKRSTNWMFAVAGLSAAAIGLLFLTLWSAAQAGRTREQLNLVSRERDRLQTAESDLRRSQQETAQLHAQLSAVTTDRARLASAVQALNKSQAEAIRLRDQVTGLTSDRDQLRAAIDRSQDEAARSRGQLEAITNDRDQLRAAVQRSQDEAARLRVQLSAVTSQHEQLRAVVAILSTPRTRTVDFGHAETVPHGRLFVNPEGLVLVGAQSPPVPSDRTLELWLMPAQGAPQAAGLFRPDSSGEFIYISSRPIDISQIKAIAVSIEPSQGTTAPTTKPIVIVPLG